MNIFLKAEHHNWGLRNLQDWDKTVFELDYAGEMHVVVYYLTPAVDCVVKVSAEDMDKIITLLPKEETVDIRACDGSAWKLEAYGKDGKMIFQRKLGYTYGIESLEIIEKILISYIPEYKKPDYSKWTEEQIENAIMEKCRK